MSLNAYRVFILELNTAKSSKIFLQKNSDENENFILFFITFFYCPRNFVYRLLFKGRFFK